MRILVTGGTGYVGRELVARLARDTRGELHVVDNLASGAHRVRAVDLERLTLHRVDLRDSMAVAALLRTLAPSLVFHLAAVHYIPACEAAPGDASCDPAIGERRPTCGRRVSEPLPGNAKTQKGGTHRRNRLSAPRP